MRELATTLWSGKEIIPFFLAKLLESAWQTSFVRDSQGLSREEAGTFRGIFASLGLWGIMKDIVRGCTQGENWRDATGITRDTGRDATGITRDSGRRNEGSLQDVEKISRDSTGKSPGYPIWNTEYYPALPGDYPHIILTQKSPTGPRNPSGPGACLEGCK